MPGRLTTAESIDAIESLLRTGVPSIKLIGLSGDDAMSWKDCIEFEGDRYWVDMHEPSRSNPHYSIEVKYRRRR